VMSSILEDKGPVQRSLLLGACAAGPPLGGGPVHRGGGPLLWHRPQIPRTRRWRRPKSRRRRQSRHVIGDDRHRPQVRDLRRPSPFPSPLPSHGAPEMASGGLLASA
jgi:hypothetical protein